MADSHKNELKGMVIDGVAASEAIDSSGEILDVKGCDISDLENGLAVLNWEHKSEKNDDHSSLDILGKITYAKKIFKAADCEDDRQLDYWKKVQLPFVYMKARLYDGAGHPAAVAAAAMIRDHHANGEPILLRYSIEGATLKRDGNRLEKTVARRVSATIKPCNRTAYSGLLEDPLAGKDQVVTGIKDLLGDLKSVTKFEDPTMQRLGAGQFFELAPLGKTLTAGGYNAAPGTLTGGSALQKESLQKQHIHAKKKGVGNVIKSAFDKSKKEESSKESSEASFPEVDMPDVNQKKYKKLTEEINEEVSMSKSEQEFLDQYYRKLVKSAIKDTIKRALDLHKAEDDDEDDEDDEDEDAPSFGVNPNSKVHIIRRSTKEGKPMTPMIVDGDTLRRFHPEQPSGGRVRFDPTTGTLHTSKGSYRMHVPTDSAYSEILHDPKILKSHEEAMGNWLRLHELAKKNQIPPDLLMYASIFSAMSPRNPVPKQEIAFSHVIDMIRQGLLDPRNTSLFEKIKGGAKSEEETAKVNEFIKTHPLFQNFQNRVKSYSHKDKDVEAGGLPEFMRGYWAGPAGAGTRKVQAAGKFDEQFFPESGVYQAGLMDTTQKFKTLMNYRFMAPLIEALVKKHGTNGREIARDLLMSSKHKTPEHRKDYAEERGLSDIPDYLDMDKVGMSGFAPKTVTYLLGMAGFGDQIVADTHLSRHLWNLYSNKVVKTNIKIGLQNLLNDPSSTEEDKALARDYLSYEGVKGGQKQRKKKYETFTPHSFVRSVMWNPQNHDVMKQVDDYYRDNHPAVALVSNRFFGGPDSSGRHYIHSIFPSFWLHWLTINPHDRARFEAAGGERKQQTASFNAGTHHRPFFQIADEVISSALGTPRTMPEPEPYDPAAHQEQLGLEHEAKLGTKEKMFAEKPKAEKKPKAAAAPLPDVAETPKLPKAKKGKAKMAKSEGEDQTALDNDPNIAHEALHDLNPKLGKLMDGHLYIERLFGPAYADLFYWQKVVPHLMGDSFDVSNPPATSDGTHAGSMLKTDALLITLRQALSNWEE
jgi:hypothetical protein